MDFHLEVRPTAALVLDAVARRFVLATGRAIRGRGECVVALAGGSTPRELYRRLARAPFAARLDWSHIQFLWGDERCVPPDHEASNYRMARETLLDHVPVPPAHVHRIPGEVDPAAAAAAYERLLRDLLRTPTGPPRSAPGTRIDIVLLGLGEDGHTASLFPGTMPVNHDPGWVRAVCPPGAPVPRVTLTPVIINAAAEVMFLVLGSPKAAIVREVLEGAHRPHQLPAQSIAPVTGQLRWFLDAEAAARLREGSS